MRRTRSSIEKHKGMLNKLAFEFSKRSGVELQEMQAEAVMLYYKAENAFNPYIGIKFITFLTTVVHNGLIKFGEKMFKGMPPNKRTETEISESLSLWDVIPDNQSERQLSFWIEYSSLSKNAKELINLCLIGFATSEPKLWKMAKRSGMDWTEYQRAKNEVKGALKTLWQNS